MADKIIHPTIATVSATRHILKHFKLRASKRLGQNFLIDRSIVNGIVDAADINDGDLILEIGPGIGTLTQGLLEANAHVVAVELDKKLPAVLAETLKGYEHLNVVQGDILKVDINELMGNRPFKVVANLPYYITSSIILTLLEQRLPITKIVTMVQREVAERMVANPDTLSPKDSAKIYGALSIAVQYFTDPKIIFDVPPSAFMPQPEVTSSVIVCDVRTPPAVVDEKMFFRVVRGAFGQRRKTLLNSLMGAGFERQRLIEAMAKANIDPKIRAESLTLERFIALADALS